MSQDFIALAYLFLPWLVHTLVVFGMLFRWAKKKKASAIVFGALVQMFMPDPYVERTIAIVQEDKKQSNGESKTDDGE